MVKLSLCVYLQQDFSQRANHVKGSIFFPGVTGRIDENLVAEPHCLLQHLNTTRRKTSFMLKRNRYGTSMLVYPHKRSLSFKEIKRKHFILPLFFCCRR